MHIGGGGRNRGTVFVRPPHPMNRDLRPCLRQGWGTALTSMQTESYEKFRNRPEPDLPPLPELVGPPNLPAR